MPRIPYLLIVLYRYPYLLFKMIENPENLQKNNIWPKITTIFVFFTFSSSVVVIVLDSCLDGLAKTETFLGLVIVKIYFYSRVEVVFSFLSQFGLHFSLNMKLLCLLKELRTYFLLI